MLITYKESKDKDIACRVFVDGKKTGDIYILYNGQFQYVNSSRKTSKGCKFDTLQACKANLEE